MKHAKPFLFILFSLSIHFTSHAQPGILRDKDGFVYVRTDAGMGNNIQDTLPAGQMVYRFEQKGNWLLIDYAKNGDSRNGYVYADRYVAISSLKQLPLQRINNNTAGFYGDSLAVEVSTGPFIPAKHKLSYYDTDKKILIRIDNKKIFGTDGEMPDSEYRQIRIKTASSIYSLPDTALQELYQPTLQHTAVYYDPELKELYIHAQNSDGAGGYEVVWKTVNGKYTGRYIAYGF